MVFNLNVWFIYFSVMLVHDKISLALSVPDITAHVNNQYNQEKQGQVYNPPGEWTSCSVPLQQQADLLTNLHLDSRGITINSQYDELPRCQYQHPGTVDKKTVLVMEPGETMTMTNETGSESGNPNALAIPEGSAMSGSSGSGQGHGWFNGLLGCLRPVWTILGKANHDLKRLNQGIGK